MYVGKELRQLVVEVIEEKEGYVKFRYVKFNMINSMATRRFYERYELMEDE